MCKRLGAFNAGIPYTAGNEERPDHCRPCPTLWVQGLTLLEGGPFAQIRGHSLATREEHVFESELPDKDISRSWTGHLGEKWMSGDKIN